ncbi:MAG: dihydrofolate reductase family protein, partial [Pseudomonadota bacterium]
GITTILLEGGATLAEAFAAADLIDAATLIHGPDSLGGVAIRPFGGNVMGALSRQLMVVEHTLVGADQWAHLTRLCLQDS